MQALVLVLLLVLTSLAEVCPGRCEDAKLFCESYFGGDGSLAMTSCVIEKGVVSSFECSCNLRVGIVVRNEGGHCAWNDSFQNSPLGERCWKSTGICPSSNICVDTTDKIGLNDSTTLFAEGCSFNKLTCKVNEPAKHHLIVECDVCDGGYYSIETTGSNCSRHYVLPEPTEAHLACSPSIDCSGHGCCLPVSQRKDNLTLCTCFADDVRGYWDGPACTECSKRYEGPLCTIRKTAIVIVLTELAARPLLMTFPILISIFGFVILSIVRREWSSDEVFEITDLRRAGLNPLGLVLPRDRSGLHPKGIPSRPSSSRGMINEAETVRREAIRRGRNVPLL